MKSYGLKEKVLLRASFNVRLFRKVLTLFLFLMLACLTIKVLICNSRLGLTDTSFSEQTGDYGAVDISDN
jgi:hypothetical protein